MLEQCSIMASSSSSTVHLQRNKKHGPIRSCLPCRSRRIRCDQKHPECGNCTKQGQICRYSSAPRAAEQDQSSSQGPSISPALVEEDADNSSSRNDLGQMHRSIGGTTHYVGPSFWGISGKNGPGLTKFFEEQRSHSPDPASIFLGCSDSDAWGRPQANPMILVRNEMLQHKTFHSLDHVLRQLPSREVCDSLWMSFMTNIYPLVPILHLPSFYRQLEGFWQSVNAFRAGGSPSGALAECSSLLATILAALSSGSIHQTTTSSSTTSAAKSTNYSKLHKRLRRLTMHTLTMLGFPRDPTIFSLAAYLFWHIPLIREESEQSTSFTSTAFRIGQRLGLHRDPKHFNMSKGEAEMRRRIWWHILHKDALSSATSGLPQMMWSLQQHDVSMISETSDSASKGAQQPFRRHSPTPSDASSEGPSLNTPHKMMLPYLNCIDFRLLDDLESDCRQVVFSQQSEGIAGKDILHFEAVIEQTATQVRGRIERLGTSHGPETSGTDPSQPDNFETFCETSMSGWGLISTPQNRVFLAWSRALLSLLLQKAYCTLYQPLQSLSDRTLWHHFRETAISHFVAYIEQYIDLCTTSSFSPFHWIYPGNYQPLQAVAALLTDVLQSPNSPQAAKSRYLVDRVFSLTVRKDGVVAERDGNLQDRGLTVSAQKAWNMLWQLRHRAWSNTGVEPCVLWSCARQHDHQYVEESSDEDEEELSRENLYEETSSNARSISDLGLSQQLLENIGSRGLQDDRTFLSSGGSARQHSAETSFSFPWFAFDAEQRPLEPTLPDSTT